MTSKTTNRFAPQVRERPVRDVFDHEQDRPSRWTTVVSIAETIGCVSAEAIWIDEEGPG